MPKLTHVELGDEFSGFVTEQVQSGRFGSASEVILAALRLLRDHETEIAAFRAALKEGEESGPPVPFDVETFIESRKSRS